MYTNKHAWTNKDGTYKEVYYYICGRNKQERGHHCDYKASLRKTDIEPLVIEAVKELVSDKYFAKEIEKRIGVQTDTTAIDKELANYESKLKEVDLNKARLEREIDNLPVDTRFRERKIHDNCKSRSEFIEKAVRFYAGYLSTQNAREYLPNVVISTLKSIVAESDNRQNRMMFKLAVEIAIMQNLVALQQDIDPLSLERLRGDCVKEVKRLNGSFSFEDALDWQKD